jgi:hypothetical protein
MTEGRRRGRPRKKQVRERKTRVTGLYPHIETYWLISCSECGRVKKFRNGTAQTCSPKCRKARQRRLNAQNLPMLSMPASRCYRDKTA